jgi:hypothetical protein
LAISVIAITVPTEAAARSRRIAYSMCNSSHASQSCVSIRPPPWTPIRSNQYQKGAIDYHGSIYLHQRRSRSDVSSRQKASIAVDDGQIVAISDEESLPDTHSRIEATDRFVMSGVVDPHVHIDEVPENRAGAYETKTAAAALDGVTTLIDFAWQGDRP